MSIYQAASSQQSLLWLKPFDWGSSLSSPEQRAADASKLLRCGLNSQKSALEAMPQRCLPD